MASPNPPTIEDCLKELKLDLAKSKKELNLPHDGEEASPWDEYIAPRDLKQELQALPRKLDPSFLDTRREPESKCIANQTTLHRVFTSSSSEVHLAPAETMQCVHSAW